MDGMRRAALALSTLCARDRDWMLGRLPAAQRERIAPLLQELGGLGLVPEADIHERLRDEENRQLAAQLAGGDALAEAAIRRLDAHAPAVVVQMMADESDVAVAALTARFPWRWTAAVLQALEPSRRTRIARLVPVVRAMQDTPWRMLVRTACNRADLASETWAGAA